MNTHCPSCGAATNSAGECKNAAHAGLSYRVTYAHPSSGFKKTYFVVGKTDDGKTFVDAEELAALRHDNQIMREALELYAESPWPSVNRKARHTLASLKGKV